MRKVWRLDQVIVSWNFFTFWPTTRPLIETDRHGPGWAFDWLGFELTFEEMVPIGHRLLPWMEMKAPYSSPSDRCNEIMKEVGVAVRTWTPGKATQQTGDL